MKNIISTIAILLISTLVLFASDSEKRRPNIVLLMADDMGYECLSANGSLSHNTPVLDNLGKKGIRFNYAISQPLCTPSRVKIMTGKYNYRNYKAFGHLDINEKTFGNLLKEAGYETCVVGKWQLNGVNTKFETPEKEMLEVSIAALQAVLTAEEKESFETHEYVIEADGTKQPEPEPALLPDAAAD